jgi:hypothetical protein
LLLTSVAVMAVMAGHTRRKNQRRRSFKPFKFITPSCLLLLLLLLLLLPSPLFFLLFTLSFQVHSSSSSSSSSSGGCSARSSPRQHRLLLVIITLSITQPFSIVAIICVTVVVVVVVVVVNISIGIAVIVVVTILDGVFRKSFQGPQGGEIEVCHPMPVTKTCSRPKHVTNQQKDV